MKRKICYYPCSVIILLAFYCLTSCLRDIKLDIPPSEKEIGVSCFFSPDFCWKVNIYNTFNINDPMEGDEVENADVFIMGEGSEIIQLIYQNDSGYVSDKIPKVGVLYKLIIVAEGSDTISAISSVPELSTISNIELNLTPGDAVSQYGIEPDMISAGFNIEPLKNQAFCRVRILKFDERTGYNKYFFDDASFSRMKSLDIDTLIIEKLLPLKNKTLFGPLFDILSYYIGEVKAGELLENIEEATYLCQINYRHPEAFYMARSVTTQGIFYQTPFESYTHVGIIQGEIFSRVYFSPYEGGESWLEYLDLSEEFYLFQKDYMLQLSNRENINANPVMVYSNIKNGIGIFAGYRKQIFLLPDK